MEDRFFALMKEVHDFIGELPATTSGASVLLDKMESFFKEYSGLEFINYENRDDG